MGVLLLGLALLLAGCRGVTRHTYHVSEAELQQMGQIAGIAPCKHGPTVIAAVKRAHGGGVVVVECVRRAR